MIQGVFRGQKIPWRQKKGQKNGFFVWEKLCEQVFFRKIWSRPNPHKKAQVWGRKKFGPLKWLWGSRGPFEKSEIFVKIENIKIRTFWKWSHGRTVNDNDKWIPILERGDRGLSKSKKPFVSMSYRFQSRGLQRRVKFAVIRYKSSQRPSFNGRRRRTVQPTGSCCLIYESSWSGRHFCFLWSWSWEASFRV